MKTATNDNARERLNKEKLTQDEVDKLYDIIEVSARILEQHNIRYTIEGGTLLGAVRNGGLIEHDNDGDFDILYEDMQKILLLRPHFSAHNLEIIEVPGWGLQVFFSDSPTIAPCLRQNGEEGWTSKWPFLDLLSLQWNSARGQYIPAEDIFLNDYPNYFLTQADWEEPFEKIPFGHLQLNCISGHDKRHAYLDRHYPNWKTTLEMNMDHRASVYFSEKIVCSLEPADLKHRARSR